MPFAAPGFLSSSLEFIKSHAPGLWELIVAAVRWAWNGAASLGPPIARVAGTVADAAQSVVTTLRGALPSISGAADAISSTAAALSHFMTAIGAFFEKAKWLLILVLALIALLFLARLIYLCQLVVSVIGRLIGIKQR